MNKTELIVAVGEKAQVSQKQANTILNAILKTIVASVADGDKVTLLGFGSFEMKERQARSNHHPRTGEKIHIPATKVPVFAAGKVFKDNVLPTHRFISLPLRSHVCLKLRLT